MVDERRECEAVLTQIISARTALDRVAAQVVTSYIDECLAKQPADEARTGITRAVQLLSRGVRHDDGAAALQKLARARAGFAEQPVADHDVVAAVAKLDANLAPQRSLVKSGHVSSPRAAS